ncbi:MAG: ATP-binding protein [Methylococcales bacterium]
MFNSLFSKLALLFLLLFCLLGGLVVFVTLISTRLYQQEVMQQMNHQVANHIVKQTQLIEDGSISQTFLKDLFHSLMLVNPNLEIYLLNPKGDILSFSAPVGKVVLNNVNLKPINQYLAGRSLAPIKGDNPRSINQQKVFSVAKIYDNKTFKGYLYVILGGEQYDGMTAIIQGSHIQQLSLMVLGVALVLAMLVGMLVLFSVTRRLKNLSAVMTGFERDNTLSMSNLLHYRANGDEIDELSRTFKRMVKQIKAQLVKLKKTDSVRRELVANVSHDLRTPLATLQGYIETLIIKESQLDPDERRHYLNIAIKHCKHLNNLVDELFELAKLDAQEIKPQKESFNLAELVQDIIQKFSIIAREKQIDIITSQTATTLPFVNADIRLIERALENLIDNAIRYTPQLGKIMIELQPSKDRITVSVSDTGNGIPQADIPFIFNRFYCPQRNDPAEGQRSGLGLAIVKRIIELHQSQIKVTSQLGSLTKFTFFLPIASSL